MIYKLHDNRFYACLLYPQLLLEWVNNHHHPRLFPFSNNDSLAVSILYIIYLLESLMLILSFHPYRNCLCAAPPYLFSSLLNALSYPASILLQLELFFSNANLKTLCLLS